MQLNNDNNHLSRKYLHVDVWGLEAALVDVVVCEGLCGVGAVLIHCDGRFAMSHPSTVWT